MWKLKVLVFCGVMLSAPPLFFASSGSAIAQSASRLQSDEARQAASQLIYQESVKEAATKSFYDEKVRSRQREIDRIRRQLNASQDDTKSDKAEIARLNDQILSMQDEFVSELARRNRDMEQRIVAFRDGVEDILSTSEGLQVVTLLNNGQFKAAKDMLDALDAAYDFADRIRSAKRKRSSASVLQSGLSVSEQIKRYEAITELDPSVLWDWIFLSRQFQKAGMLPKAVIAAKHAEAIAKTDLDRFLILDELGSIYQLQGDLPNAFKAYSESLNLTLELVQRDPSSAVAQRSLAISCEKMGDIYESQGDLPKALEGYSYSLTIRIELAKWNPSSAQFQRELSVSYNKLGNIYRFQGDLPKASKAYSDSLNIRIELAKRDPSNTELQSDLSISYDNLGYIYQSQGDLPKALKAYSDSLSIWLDLAKRDPSNTDVKLDLSVNYNNIGGIYVLKGDLPKALKAYNDSLNIRLELAKRDSSNAQAQRSVMASLTRLASIGAEGYSWHMVLDKLLEMKAKGILAPSDEHLIESVKAEVAKEKATPKR